MKNTLKTALALFVLTLAVSSHCLAAVAPVPEIDPSMATGSLVLLSGVVLLVRSRHRRS